MYEGSSRVDIVASLSLRKKTLDQFRASLKSVLSRCNVSKERIRRFSRRARRYICCYYVLHNLHVGNEDDETGHNSNVTFKVKLEAIEKMVKAFKTH